MIINDPRGGAETSAEITEPQLPKLQLSEISKINPNIQEEISDISYWGNYTMVLLKDSNELLCFDEKGQEVEDFKKIAKADVGFPMPAGKNYFSKIKTFDRSGLDISGNELLSRIVIPLFGGSGVNTYMETKDVVNKIANQIKKDPFKISVVKNGMYVVLFHEKSKYFVAFKTCNDTGDPLPPRNWAKIYPKTEDFPTDLTSILVTMQKSVDSKIKPINENKKIEIGDDSISILGASSAKLFTDKIDKVDNNFCVDPRNNEVVYYCRTTNPVEIVKLDLSGDPKTWKPAAARIPKKYAAIQNLQIHPGGNFFMFNRAEGLIVLSSDTLEEVGFLQDVSHPSFDSQGRIRGINKNNEFVLFDSNLPQIARAAKAKKLTTRIAGLGDLFQGVRGHKPDVNDDAQTAGGGTDLSYLDQYKSGYETDILPVIKGAATLVELRQYTGDLDQLKRQLRTSDLSASEINYMTGEIARALTEKEKELATNKVAVTLDQVRFGLTGLTDITVAAEIRQKVEGLQQILHLVDEPSRKAVIGFNSEVTRETARIFRERGEEIVHDVQKLMEGVKNELEKFERKTDFDDWVEYRLPQLKARLTNLANECPLELTTVNSEIMASRQKLNRLKDEYEEKFRIAYAQIREKAATKHDETMNVLDEDIDDLLERVRDKRFSSRIQAEQYVADSPAYGQLVAAIEVFKSKDPDRAAELERKLKVQLAIVYNEIERGAFTHIAGTGQQIVKFGEAEFLRWEGHVKEKLKQTVELTWIPDEKSKGPGIGPQDMYGDIAVRISEPSGKSKVIRLYEGEKNESDWRYGNLTYRGESVMPTYLKQKDFRKLKDLYADWQRGNGSKLRKDFTERKTKLAQIYRDSKATKPEPPYEGDTYEAWKRPFQEALAEYAHFCAENFITTLRQIERAKNAPVSEDGNGKGYIPEWSSHWVLDKQTEKYLEEMTKVFKMQLDLQEGLLLLKGHAGTGKDVLMKMFCERTHRPYFAIDCSRWTTEFELSEDIVLEAEDGASKTIKVPSTVLNAITTPGAVMYFNEINAMPEQAQIFLHALMDEKRAITLKTSSGKTIKAEKSVVLAGSMNPGYPGTFDPQMATKSRTVPLQIDYPPLLRPRDPTDPNPNPVFDSSEALRIARSVKSLADFTYEPNMDRNEFVKVWDNQVNGMSNGPPILTDIQRFDIEVIMSLVQFGAKLRENFIMKFEKGPNSRKALPVTQPLTLREMRRCAYELGQIPLAQRATTNPEQVARDLLTKYFLSHIDKQDDREKIGQAMNSWTSKRRVSL